VSVGGSGVTVTNVTVSSGTSLTANFVLDPTAADGFRTVTVTTAAGTSGPRIFAITLPAPGAPTLTSVTPNQGIQGTTVAVTLTGTNFVVGATTVNVSGGGVTVTNVVVGGSISLTASFVLDPAAASGVRMVTVTTAAGTSGAQTFTISLTPGPGTPTLTSVSPNQGLQGTTVAVTLTGTNFAVGATAVTVTGGGVTVNSVVVGSSTSLTANFVLDPAAVIGPRIVTVTTAGGTSTPQGFTISLPPPTLTSVSPNQGIRGETVLVTLTGTNFAVGATTVSVSADVTVANVVVGSSTSLTASFVLDLVPLSGPRAVTVTTAGGTSGAQTFTINLPATGSEAFLIPGTRTFTVPAGVVSILIEAIGAAGGDSSLGFALAGRGGRAVARVSVAPGTVLTVRVGGQGQAGATGSIAVGGVNGGGASTGDGGGGGGGATSVRDGEFPLVIAGGGGGSGLKTSGIGGGGGDGGGLDGRPGEINPAGGLWGGGGGSSFTAPGATDVIHQQGVGLSGSVIISW
jgi:Glycine rich protein/IPT/TIG domain